MEHGIESHLRYRHLNKDLYDGVYFDEDERSITFLLWNLSGQLVGYQRYKPEATKEARNDPREGRYFTRVGGESRNRHLAVWGLESLSWRSDILVVCEGIFDACRFHNEGIPAIALLTNNDVRYKNWLDCLDRRLYAALDDHATKFTDMINLDLPEGRVDFGECSDEEIKQTVERMLCL